MSKEFDLYEKDDLTFKTKVFYLMDLMVTNKFLSDGECILLIFLSYFQILAGFYSEDVNIFTLKGDGPDPVLTNLQNILRVKDLFYENYTVYELLIIMIFGLIFIQLFIFFNSIKYMNRYSNYTLREKLLNYTFKYFHYILLTPVLDLSFSLVCFSEYNPNFKEKLCSLTESPHISIFSFLIFIYSILLSIFLSIFYNDSFFLSHSSLSRTNCNYELYHNINIILYSILLSLVKYIGKEVFMIYNLAFSIFSTRYYMNNYPYFNNSISLITGCYQFLYTWTSIFIVYLSFFDCSQRSLVYILGSFIVVWMFRNVKYKFEEKIILDTPFNKITNKSHILFYVNAILKKIQTMEQNDEDKAEMIGIIQMHISECPIIDCPAKKKERIYLPLIEEWTNRNIHEINDKIFLINFINFIFNYYISQNYMSPDLYMNLALYYLQVVGNLFMSAFYFNKVSEFKLSDQEKFSFFRLHRIIQKSLIEKLKPTSEACYNMQELNTTMYFKYDDLGQKFFDEITFDCNINLEFWKIFQGYKEKNDKLDFNRIFTLTDKIRISKNKIEKYWEELFNIYNGFNDMFELYENYVCYINDDGVLFRELELTKNKILLSSDNINSNFTSVLFSKETGLLIANGDKGKEGLIEHVNEQIESIFNFRSEELKGININKLMPKIFSKSHHVFMEQYNNIGEKKIINKTFNSYGKDRLNNLIPLILRTKNFPILSDYIFYISLISKQNYDDVILLDSKFNIQGMSQRLMEKFSLNENIFQDCDIPFYLFCKKFISHYKRNLPKEFNGEKTIKNFSKLEKELKEQVSGLNNNDDKGNEENYSLETHENAELEFEIRIPPLIQNYVSNYTNREGNRLEIDHDIEEISEEENLDVIEEVEDNRIDESANHESEENKYFLNNIQVNSNRKQGINYNGNATNYNTGNMNINMINNSNQLNNISNNNYNTPIPESRFQSLQTAQTHIGNSNNILERRDSTKNVAGKYEDQEIQYKINYFKNLFEKRAFDNLESELDRLNHENGMEEYKFIFTCENYKFGYDIKIGYVVRCIERQFDDIISYSDGSRQKEILKNGPLRQFTTHLFQNKKAKKSYLYKHLIDYFEYTQEDIKLHNSEQGKILKRYFEELIENNLFNDSKIFLLQNSKIFTMNHEENDKADDKASSHQSITTNQDEYSKKSRIMELKSNLTKNIDKFYTLRSIKTIFLIMVVLAAIFSFNFIIKFSDILSDMFNLHFFSNLLTRSIFAFSEITANLISLKSIFFLYFNKNNYFLVKDFENQKINIFNSTNINVTNFNTFLENKENYFQYLKNYSCYKLSNLTYYFSKIESLMQQYLESSSQELYWNQVENIHIYSYKMINGAFNPISFNKKNNGQNYLTVPFGEFVLEIITNVNEIIKSTFYTINDFKNNLMKIANEPFYKKNLLFNYNSVYSSESLLYKNNSSNFTYEEFYSGLNKNLHKLNYSNYMSIQGSYFIAIPNLLLSNNEIYSHLIRINNDNLNQILILFISFSSIFIFLGLLFIIFLCLTNSNMQQGLEKVSLIPTEKINETINKISDFKEKVLNKFIKLDFMFTGKNLEKEKSIGNKILAKRKEKERQFAEKLAANKYAFDENRQIKNLKILNSSYYKALFIVGILATILIPVFFQCKWLIDNSNKILIYKRYIIKDLMNMNLNILNIKCKISSCDKSQFINREIDENYNLYFNHSLYENSFSEDEMNSITVNFPEINDFYENKYILDICTTISSINEITYNLNPNQVKTEVENLCKNDIVIKSANNTLSLISLIKDSIYNLNKNITLQTSDNKLNEFSSDNFRMIEYIYFNYLNKVYPNMEYYIELALENFSFKIQIFIVTFMILFTFLIFFFALYIYLVYVKSLIHMLSISRCVLRVIPTNVIYDTPKLEAWIENKF